MPTRTTSLTRFAECVNTLLGNAIGGVNAVRFVDETVALPRSMCSHSSFADHRAANAYSVPTPTVQPALVFDSDAVSKAVANVSVKIQLALISDTARPTVK